MPVPFAMRGGGSRIKKQRGSTVTIPPSEGIVYRSHDFSDGTIGSLDKVETNGAVTVVTGSGFNGGTKYARCLTDDASTSGRACLQDSFLESATRDGKVYWLTWSQRFTLDTLALSREIGNQIKTLLQRSSDLNAHPSFGWIMASLGYAAYEEPSGSGNNTYSFAQDFDIQYLSSPGNLLKYVEQTAPDLFKIYQTGLRKSAPASGHVRVFHEDAEIGSESSGGDAAEFGNVSDPSAVFDSRVGLAFYQRQSDQLDRPYDTHIGKMMSSDFRPTIAQFQAQANV